MTEDLPIIRGSFVHWLPVKGRAVLQLQIEVPTEQGHRIMDILGFPHPGTEIPVAIARLTAEAALRDVDNGGGSAKPPVDAGGEDACVPAQPVAPAKRRWSEMSRAQRAGMLCEDEPFRHWLVTKSGLWFPRDAETWSDALASAIRAACAIGSRRELDTNEAAAARWDALETRFLQATGRMAVDR